MVIVNDIQDAMMMQNKLVSVLRRSQTFGMNVSDIQLEIELIVGDLLQNIDRIETQMEEEV
jgi:KaiC/GvpD/RAD55 family RecA-like ATPase